MQAAEALWRLGDAEGLKSLVASSLSPYSDFQKVALLALALPRDRIVLGHVQSGLSSDTLDVRLVAARACGMLGSAEGYQEALASTASACIISSFLSCFSASFSTSSGIPALAIFSRSSATSAAFSSMSPSSCWICRSCSRR